MSGAPYIRFFGDDWLSGTHELSLEERGALITLVALTASTGQSPRADYERLGRRFGTTKGRAKKVVQALMDLGKITLEDDTLVNTRARSELEIAQKYSEKQSERRRGVSSKKEKKGNKNNASSKPRFNRGSTNHNHNQITPKPPRGDLDIFGENDPPPRPDDPVQADVFDHLLGQGKAGTWACWFEPCRWDGRTLHPPSRLVRDKLENFNGHILRQFDLRVGAIKPALAVAS
jgi:uncharacterized protein YdaU (DUF1376 family)